MTSQRKTPTALLLTLLLCGISLNAASGAPTGADDELQGLTPRQCILLRMLGAPVPPECDDPAGPRPPPSDDEAVLRDLEEQHRLAMLNRDFDVMLGIWPELFVVNSPLDVVAGPRAAIMGLLQNIMHLSVFEKDLEAVRVFGDTAITMGADVMVRSQPPAAGVAQHRRFTGFWERINGRWWMVARHETVIARELTVFGDPVEAGDGEVRTFLTFDPTTRKPAALGVQWDTRWASLPPEPPATGGEGYSFPAPLPAAAAGIVPYRHLTWDWQPHGHPVPPYAVPHLDVHFYLITQDERGEIAPGNCEGVPFPVSCDTLQRAMAPLPPEAQPPNHTIVGPTVPFMGLHLRDQDADEMHGHPFGNTLIFGKFDGRIIFLEPMITVDHFEALTEADCRPIANPQRFAEAGWYPTTYCARNNGGVYSVSLEDFERFEAVE